MATIAISITEETLERIKNETNKMGVNRSSLISIAINEYIERKERERNGKA